ncbi:MULTISPECIES: H-NS family nucleoid-associated regulatory protein [Xanthomonas]|uniref:H-NS histone family protein n=1 Tax=Xanthomonas dyei TaxID=743699 RepID=A0ABZ0DHN7_9XANT|nr:H-NS family nucleoid-associated regulatory protein [Xanthomonas dyei]WOB27740.1 H-NS histone family protein [Xanthomonas dyei]WOB55362.1 H-NS histone family protein [Xanthomonas dyei]
MARTLKDIAAEKAKAQALLVKLEQEAKDIAKAEATKRFPEVVEFLSTYAEHYTTQQKRELGALLGFVEKKAGKVGGTATRAPKYQIADGTTWAGNGKHPTKFLNWLATAEGKAWQKKHPNEKYPAYPYTTD